MSKIGNENCLEIMAKSYVIKEWLTMFLFSIK